MRNSFSLKRIAVVALAALLLLIVTPAGAQQAKPSSSGYAPVNGIKMYYEVYGEGTPIILLHGAFYTIDLNWSQLIPELSKTHKVIALEFQGHGHTPYSEREMSITNFSADVKGLMDYLKIDSADIAGYSMGGSVAYQFAIDNPARVRRMVIISSTYKSSGWLPVVNTGFSNLSTDIFNNTPLQTAYDAVAPDKKNWTKFLKQMFAFADVPFDCGDSNVAKITAPVMIISGDNDGLDKVELAKTYQMLGGGVAADLQPMPKARLAIVPGQSHVSVMMQTSTIAAYLQDFLK